MTDRTQRAIDILLESYNRNTLLSGNCNACAVGNIVAASNNRILVPYVAPYEKEVSIKNGVLRVREKPERYELKPTNAKNGEIDPNSSWASLFVTVVKKDGSFETLSNDHPRLRERSINHELAVAKGKEDIANTGFSINELMRIERAFETASTKDFYGVKEVTREMKEDQLVRLNAVVQVLLDIEKNVDNTVEEVFTSKALPVEQLVPA